jgi:hypothetical protein
MMIGPAFLDSGGFIFNLCALRNSTKRQNNLHTYRQYVEPRNALQWELVKIFSLFYKTMNENIQIDINPIRVLGLLVKRTFRKLSSILPVNVQKFQVKRYMLDEASIIYECKTCHNMFR